MDESTACNADNITYVPVLELKLLLLKIFNGV